MDMWTMRLRRTGCVRGQRGAARHALPTDAPFAHMTTAFDVEEIYRDVLQGESRDHETAAKKVMGL
jgi:hypothetical protein